MKVVFKKIQNGVISVLDSRVFSEAELRSLADIINGDSSKSLLVRNFILQISKFGRNFDWNVGSILQHIDPELIIAALQEKHDSGIFNSIGLAWVLGEFNNTDRTIIDFLYGIVENATDSDAWWRAAFSLEKLGLEEAVSLLKMSLKGELLKDLDYYLAHLEDKKSVISVLVLSNVENIEQTIYPRIKETFLKSADDAIVINCCWLLGRLKLIDPQIYAKLFSLISHTNYELKYYTFFALQHNATESLRPVLERALRDHDPLIRKMATRGLISIGNERSLAILKDVLNKEQDGSVVAEVCRAMYQLKNPADRARLLLEIRSSRNENGTISDESDKWYSDPAIYQTFSEAEDPENICFSLILERLGSLPAVNPIDIATGTGRMVWQIIEKLPFSGTLYALDASRQMCDFLGKRVRRERKFTNNISVINSTISDAAKHIKRQSSFIVSSFGFPSKISDARSCLEELRTIHELLEDDGLFFTIGWDETFNDDLSRMWFKFIPDRIPGRHFEDWRRKRAAAISSPRNVGLSWLKKGIAVPLQFSSLNEAAFVMGYLFGRDAAQHVVNTGRTEWGMSLGITCNTKNELKELIAS